MEMESLRTPDIRVETLWRTILVTDARNSSKAYFSERADEALMRIERDRALFAQIAAQHGGEEARDRGDGSMFAFCDPIAALRAAMAMQAEIVRLNAELPDESLHLVHRMGLQMGALKLATTRIPGTDIVRRKLSGDLVVTATRLEAICHPGEVCFSNEVYRIVRGRIDHEFRFLDATLKGFDRPMRCWSTRFDREWARPLTSEEEGVRQRRNEERRLREKWEREQREKRMRHVGVRVAAAFAVVSVAFAGLQFVRTATGFNARLSSAWIALRGAGGDVPLARTEMVSLSMEAPVVDKPNGSRDHPLNLPLARIASRGLVRHGSSYHRVSAVLRQALTDGRLDDVPAQLAALNLPDGEYQSACDSALTFERARDWLSARMEDAVGDETKGVTLEPPVAGLTVLTHADERAVVGLDETEHHRTIPFASLAPADFGALLKAASTGAETAPENPDADAQSLAALKRRIRPR